MRLLFLSLISIFSLVSSASFKEVRFQIFSNTDDDFDSLLKVGRRIHADNKHTTIVSEVVHCTGDSSPSQCAEVNNQDILVVLSHDDVLSEKYYLSSEDKTAHVQLVERGFIDFFGKCLGEFRRRSEQLDHSDALEPLSNLFQTSSLRELYDKARLPTEEALNRFVLENKDEKVIFLLMLNTESFNGFPYLLHSLEMSISTNFKLGIVSCLETPELCSDTSVSNLVSYKDGERYKLYDGELNYPSIRDWAKRLANPVLSVLSSDIVPMYRSGIIPGFEQAQDTVTMLFIPTKKNQVYKDYLNFAKETHGKYHLTVMIEKEIAKWPNQPAFITMKPLEQVSKAFVKFQDINYESMAHYISTGIYPSIHDLNSAQSVLTALSIASPLTIFFDPTKLKEQTPFAKLASEHPIRQNTSEFAVVIGSNLFGTYFIERLGLDLSQPSYILINQDRTCIHTKRIAKENRDEILHWISSSLKKPCAREIQFDLNEIVNLSKWEQYESIKDLLNNKQLGKSHDEL
ncbi:unnamed protein product [Auanema sp. JU1783]|nr:unnamed protein product [Auanema sp. JU1783]